MTLTLGEIARLLHEGERLGEVLEREPALNPAGIIEKNPVRRLAMMRFGLISREGRNSASAGGAGLGCQGSGVGRGGSWAPGFAPVYDELGAREVSGILKANASLAPQTERRACR
jgi:hypothetical protein